MAEEWLLRRTGDDSEEGRINRLRRRVWERSSYGRGMLVGQRGRTSSFALATHSLPRVAESRLARGDVLLLVFLSLPSNYSAYRSYGVVPHEGSRPRLKETRSTFGTIPGGWLLSAALWGAGKRNRAGGST